MNSDNILSVNVANGVSIVIMASVGLFLLSLARGAMKAKQSPTAPGVPGT